MFAKAVQKGAIAPASKPSPIDSRQQINTHPSSSNPSALHNSDIRQHVRKPGYASSSYRGSSQTQVSKPSPVKPLHARTFNDLSGLRAPPPGRSLETLCGKSDSFKEEPDENGFLVVTSAGRQHEAQIYIGADDFSDDDGLDLDFQQPLTLPLPPQPLPAQQQQARLPREPTPSSAMSWPPSSPSHYRAPQGRPSALRRSSAKRESPIEESPLPQAKKRQVPKHWAKSREDAIDLVSPEKKKATPAPKKKSTEIWNASASAIKDRKNDMKRLNKEQMMKKAIALEKSDAKAEAAGEQPPAPALTSSKAAKNVAIALSGEQRHVKDLVCKQKNSVFFTGPAGTGKSVLMRAIIADLKKKYLRHPERLAVTASTGLAACNIGGMTLHSFAGIGLGKEEVRELIKKIRRNQKAKNRWLQTQVLIIDEISMVDGALFDKLSEIGRTIRNNGRPWGGIQLVITGDFFQLPPVPDGSKTRDIKFAFEAATWDTSIDHTIGLTEVFRQKDPVFAQMLNEMRLGRISEQTNQVFKSLSRPIEFEDGPQATELFATRNEVDGSNLRRLNSLPGKTYRFEAVDAGDPLKRDRLLQHMMAPKQIDLKKGAQVMLIKNMDDSLVNGSLGTVTGFATESTFELMGAGVVGNDDAEEIDPNVKKRIQAFSRQLDTGTGSDSNEYPMVQFHTADGTSRTLLCVPEEWKVELSTGEVEASRKQLPLILAWALSIHKAQGQTLDRVKVDLGRVFEKGQAYVALSRATSQEGLQVLRFQSHKVLAHPRVSSFYNKLYSADVAIQRKTTVAVPSIADFAQRGSTSTTSSVRRNLSDDGMNYHDEEEALAAYG